MQDYSFMERKFDIRCHSHPIHLLYKAGRAAFCHRTRNSVGLKEIKAALTHGSADLLPLVCSDSPA